MVLRIVPSSVQELLIKVVLSKVKRIYEWIPPSQVIKTLTENTTILYKINYCLIYCNVHAHVKILQSSVYCLFTEDSFE